MAQTTSIEWTATRSIGRDGIEVVTPGSTWNPLRGTLGKWSCVKVSPGCAHCYAERMNARFGGPAYRVGADTVRLDEKALTEPLRWRTGRKVFVCSMTDLFGEWVTDDQLDRIFAVMARCEVYDHAAHTFQVLTKRPDRMQRYLSDRATYHRLVYAIDCPDGALPWPLPNVWVGVSVEDQQRADERIPALVQTPAVVRFLSMEPLLGPIDLTGCLGDTMTCPVHGPIARVYWTTQKTCRRCVEDGAGSADRAPALVRTMVPGVDWVIVGGESGGPGTRRLVASCYHPRIPARAEARHCPDCGGTGWVPKPDALGWVRAIRDQCGAAGVPFLFKQWGGPTPKAGGRLLDGREWNEFPKGGG